MCRTSGAPDFLREFSQAFRPGLTYAAPPVRPCHRQGLRVKRRSCAAMSDDSGRAHRSARMSAMTNRAIQDKEVPKKARGEHNRGAVIVTGASRGIGAAIARLIGANGFPVAVNFLTNRAGAEEVVREIVAGGGRAVAIHADVSREADILRLFEPAVRELGKIGGLVNNAGVTGGLFRVDAVPAAGDRGSLGHKRRGHDIVFARGGAADVLAPRWSGWFDRQHLVVGCEDGWRWGMGTLRGV
jgi:hypothetical protein